MESEIAVRRRRVFLGGTCNDSSWRQALIPMLDGVGVDYFNPVVADWNCEAYQRELMERETCDYVLYVITPKMTGVYSIAEVVDDSNKRPRKTIFCFLPKDSDGLTSFQFTEAQTKSLTAVGKMVEANGGTFLRDLASVATALSSTIP
jgi:hypothetical protein